MNDKCVRDTLHHSGALSLLRFYQSLPPGALEPEVRTYWEEDSPAGRDATQLSWLGGQGSRVLVWEDVGSAALEAAVRDVPGVANYYGRLPGTHVVAEAIAALHAPHAPDGGGRDG